MEVGCLRHPGASTIGNQLLDEDHFYGYPAMSPHAIGGTGTLLIQWKEGGKSGWEGNCLEDELSLQNRQKNASCTYATLRSTSTRNSNACAYVSTPLSTRGTQALFVVKYVTLPLTAFLQELFDTRFSNKTLYYTTY